MGLQMLGRQLKTLPLMPESSSWMPLRMLGISSWTFFRSSKAHKSWANSSIFFCTSYHGCRNEPFHGECNHSAAPADGVVFFFVQDKSVFKCHHCTEAEGIVDVT